MSKLPKKYPEFVCKAQWDATAVYLTISAKNAIEAKDRAWKQIARTIGGDSCLKVTVIAQRD